jgi:hypothetical protein
VHESQGSIEITVMLSEISANTITADYATSDRTATAGSDYTAANGTLTFNPGETRKTFSVIISDNGIDENDEIFDITLTNPVNALLGSLSSIQVTISRQQSTAPVLTGPVNGSHLADTEITVSGRSESGAIVEIFVNGISQGTAVASFSGYFSFNAVISSGENTVTAVSTNSYGQISPVSLPVTVFLDPRPQVPSGLSVTPGDTVVNIAWNSNPDSDIQGYNIYRDRMKLNNNVLTATTFTDMFLTNGKEYTYTITAVDNNNSESLPASITATSVAGAGW